jgi:hypothetical protein
MADYIKLPTNWNQPDPVEEPAVPAPIVVDCVYNELVDGNGKTVALKVSIRLPLNS